MSMKLKEIQKIFQNAPPPYDSFADTRIFTFTTSFTTVSVRARVKVRLEPRSDALSIIGGHLRGERLTLLKNTHYSPWSRTSTLVTTSGRNVSTDCLCDNFPL